MKNSSIILADVFILKKNYMKNFQFDLVIVGFDSQSQHIKNV